MKPFLLLMLLLTSLTLNAQDHTRSIVLKPVFQSPNLSPELPEEKKRLQGFWVDLGLATATLPNDAIGVGVGLSFQNDFNLVSFRFMTLEEFDFDIFGSDNITENAIEMTAMYGLSAKGRYGYVAASTGLSYTRATLQGKYLYSIPEDDCDWFCFEDAVYAEKHLSTWGIPIQLEAGFTPLPMLGISFKTFVNLNPKKNYHGAFLSIQIGNLGFADSK